jgi:hypothetical protein
MATEKNFFRTESSIQLNSNNIPPYEMFNHLDKDLFKMDRNNDFYTLYRVAIAFTESFIYNVKSTLINQKWNFLSSDDQYAKDLRYILVSHIDENKKTLIRLPSLQRLSLHERKHLNTLAAPLLDYDFLQKS